MRRGKSLSWLLKAPIAIYSVHAGWLLGHRFLLLTHRGRRTGRIHRTMLEVVAWDQQTHEAVVMAGLGTHAQWYRNVLANDPVEIQIAKLRFVPQVRQLDTDEAARALAAYERRNRIATPIVRFVLSKLSRVPYDGSDSRRKELVQALPLLAFSPRRSAHSSNKAQVATTENGSPVPGSSSSGH